METNQRAGSDDEEHVDTMVAVLARYRAIVAELRRLPRGSTAYRSGREVEQALARRIRSWRRI